MTTKKDYIEIAKIMSSEKAKLLDGQHGRIINKLADYFSSDNQLFDRAKFIKACNN